MPRRFAFLCDDRGAVAATYAIAVTGLIIVAGAAFDYNRVMALDSEMQTAADHAALAGATQLDKQDGACARAGNAAVDLLRNVTLLSNVESGNAITANGGSTISVANDQCGGFTGITFYKDRDKTTVAATDEEARYIEVAVDTRAARYAFTAIGSLAGSDTSGRAMAGIGAAICRVPPLKICSPTEPSGNTDVFLDFPVSANIGAGIRLLGNETDVPGAFGFLQTEFGSGANGLLAALGWDVRGGDCVSVDGVEIQNGVVNSARDGINVRFDMPGNGQYCPSINGISGTCSPSVNVRKDQVRAATGNSSWETHLGTGAANAHLGAYRPTSAATYEAIWGTGVTPLVMGHPRDMCHAWSEDGSCAASTGFTTPLVGDGAWDINAYWRSNFGANYTAGTIALNAYGVQSRYSYPTRYQVYRWEADQIAAGSLPGVTKSVGGNKFAYAQPQAGKEAATASSPYGLVPGSDLDRRRMSVAVLNCGALQAKYGNSLNNRVLEVANWIDIFLVEPAVARTRCQGGGGGCNDKFTNQFEVYVEIIGETNIGGDNGTNLQTVRRDLPHLIE